MKKISIVVLFKITVHGEVIKLCNIAGSYTDEAIEATENNQRCYGAL